MLDKWNTMRVPQGLILVKDKLPSRNGIVLTSTPKYKRGVVVIGSTNIKEGEHIAFKTNGDLVRVDGEQLRLIREDLITLRASEEIIMNAEMDDTFHFTKRVTVVTK